MLLAARLTVCQASRCHAFTRNRHKTHYVTRSSLPLDEPVQSYISTTHSPILNLSIEHYLLTSTPPESTILFLYRNTPSIILGRNQNPWLEVNLHALRQGIPADHTLNAQQRNAGVQIRDRVQLVRRRSGGGTVFHDLGNTNWTVICPPGNFTRDKSAEMVVRSLRNLGIERARVNERHDIVLDTSPAKVGDVDPDDTHRTPWTTDVSSPDIRTSDAEPLARKVSGSAYKLTKNRALHHGTALLSSPNLGQLSSILRSPSKDAITAKGVASVSSPVCNIGITHQDFCQSVQRQFSREYRDVKTIELGRDMASVPDIRKGMDEMSTMDWLLGGTPGFTFTHGDISLDVKHGTIASVSDTLDHERLIGRSLAESWEWRDVLHAEQQERADILERLLPTAGALSLGQGK